MQTHKLNLFADYFTITVQDESAEGDFSQGFTDEAIQKMLIAVLPDAIGIQTMRNMTVPVEVVVTDKAPEDDFSEYDRVNECSLEVPSGKIVVMGNEYFPEAKRIEVVPGIYRVRIYYKNLDTVDIDQLEGHDEYKVVLWPQTPFAPMQVLEGE
jgi:hypothetical protein